MLPVEISQMSAVPSAVFPNRCLRIRNADSACKYCIDACPTHAIRLDRREPWVDTERCLGCGVCLVACPVESFEASDWSEQSVVGALDRIAKPSVELACKLHPEPAVGNEASPVVQVSACLGAISPGLWYEIGLRYSVKARLEYCAACPMGKEASYARRAIDVASRWLAASTRPSTHQGDITVKEDCDDAAQSRRRVVISAERPILNRRDFLFGFARSTGPADLALRGLPLGQDNESKSAKVGPHVPAWLRRVAAVYPDSPMGEKAEGSSHLAQEQINWPTLSVAENCAACQSCSLNCPSGALVTEAVSGIYRHVFTPGLCVSCGLCAQVCPTGALTRSYAVDDHPFEKRTMAQRGISTCSRCGRPALETAEHLCFCCASEPNIDPVLDSARTHLLRS